MKSIYIEYLSYVENFIIDNIDNQNFYKNENDSERIRNYSEYILKKLKEIKDNEELFKNIKEDIDIISFEIKMLFHNFKSYQEFRRKQKIKEMLK